MTTQTVARVTNRAAAPKIANREPFTNSTGSFRGVSGDKANNGTGLMPKDEAYDYLAQKMWGFIDYVVFSYATPIAWYSNRDGWHVTKEGYSMTTKCKHLPPVREAMRL